MDYTHDEADWRDYEAELKAIRRQSSQKYLPDPHTLQQRVAKVRAAWNSESREVRRPQTYGQGAAEKWGHGFGRCVDRMIDLGDLSND